MNRAGFRRERMRQRAVDGDPHRAASAPGPISIALKAEDVDSGLVKFVQYLARNRVRATYSAIAEAADVPTRSVGTLLGARSALGSWVVNGNTGEPTGYSAHEKDPHLYDKEEIITSGADCVVR